MADAASTRRRTGSAVLLAACLLPAVARAGGRESVTLHVSPAGDDRAAGTRQAPLRTPALALARLAPGGTLVLLPGSYPVDDHDRILRPPSGRSGSPTVIRGEGPGRPRLAGSRGVAALVDLAGVHHLVLSGLELTHAPGGDPRVEDGIAALVSPAGDLLLRDLEVHHLDGFGLNAGDLADTRIETCRFHHNGGGGLGGPEGRRGGWQRVRIEATELSDSGRYWRGGDGRDRPYDRPDGIGIEASEGPVELVACRAERNLGDGIDLKARRSSVTDCRVVANHGDGVKLWGRGSRALRTRIDRTAIPAEVDSPWALLVIDQIEDEGADFEVSACTLVENPRRHAFPLYVQYGVPVPIQLRFHGNRVEWGSSAAYFGPRVGLDARDNVWVAHSGEPEVVQQGERYLTCRELPRLGPGNRCERAGAAR